MRRSVDGMLFVSWLGLGTTIELLGYYLGLYKFIHWAFPVFVAVVLFGVVAPLMQKMLGERSLAFAMLIFVSAAAIEFANAAWLHWWTFHDNVRQNLPSDWLLAVGTSGPLFFVSWLMSFSFRPKRQNDVTLPYLVLHGGETLVVKRVLIFCAICVLLLVALGRYGNAEYILRPFGIGYLAATAPLEPRSLPAGIGAGTAILVFAFHAVLILLAVILAVRKCGLSAPLLGLGLGRLSIRQGLPLLLFLCIAPLPTFILAGLDPAMSANYPFVQSFSGVTSFIAYQFGYLLFFFTVEALFRSLLFLGFASVAAPTEMPGASDHSAPMMFAGILSCLCYIVWHLGKPLPELVGAIIWGPIACAIIWRTRSILYLVIPHWLWNLVLDAFVTLKRLPLFSS
jgi:hypothetical protein